MVMAKTASLNASNRMVSRPTRGGSSPVSPAGARATANQRSQRITEKALAAPLAHERRADPATTSDRGRPLPFDVRRLRVSRPWRHGDADEREVRVPRISVLKRRPHGYVDRRAGH